MIPRRERLRQYSPKIKKARHRQAFSENLITMKLPHIIHILISIKGL